MAAGESGGRLAIPVGRSGIALPAIAFDAGESAYARFVQNFRQALRDSQPAVVTTSGDLPATASMKRLAELSGIITQPA